MTSQNAINAPTTAVTIVSPGSPIPIITTQERISKENKENQRVKAK